MNTSKKPKASVPDSQAGDAVRKRAYELYEQRGREEGHALEDWLAAEAELTSPKHKVIAA